MLLRLDGDARLLDDRSRLFLCLLSYVCTQSLTGFLRVRDDLRGLRLRVGQLRLVLHEHALRLDARLLGPLQRLRNRLLALLQHTREHGPAELPQHDDENDEGNEHGERLDHIRDDDRDTLLLLCKRERRESKRGAGGSTREGKPGLCFVRSIVH